MNTSKISNLIEKIGNLAVEIVFFTEKTDILTEKIYCLNERFFLLMLAYFFYLGNLISSTEHFKICHTFLSIHRKGLTRYSFSSYYCEWSLIALWLMHINVYHFSATDTDENVNQLSFDLCVIIWNWLFCSEFFDCNKNIRKQNDNACLLFYAYSFL